MIHTTIMGYISGFDTIASYGFIGFIDTHTYHGLLNKTLVHRLTMGLLFILIHLLITLTHWLHMGLFVPRGSLHFNGFIFIYGFILHF